MLLGGKGWKVSGLMSCRRDCGGDAAMKGPGMPTPSLPKGSRMRDAGLANAVMRRGGDGLRLHGGGGEDQAGDAAGLAGEEEIAAAARQGLREEQCEEGQAEGEVADFDRGGVEHEAERQESGGGGERGDREGGKFALPVFDDEAGEDRDQDGQCGGDEISGAARI